VKQPSRPEPIFRLLRITSRTTTAPGDRGQSPTPGTDPRARLSLTVRTAHQAMSKPEASPLPRGLPGAAAEAMDKRCSAIQIAGAPDAPYLLQRREPKRRGLEQHPAERKGAFPPAPKGGTSLCRAQKRAAREDHSDLTATSTADHPLIC